MKDQFANQRKFIELTLHQILPPVDEEPTELSQGLRWAVMGGGKRLRPLFCMLVGDLLGVAPKKSLYLGCAIELLHCYTLVHDDLPCLDNDTMRRGKKSVWAKFGEAQALLVGDTLQAAAFHALTKIPDLSTEVVSAFADFAQEVVDGQVRELSFRKAHPKPLNKSNTSEEVILDVQNCYSRKTASPFMYAVIMNTLMAKSAYEKGEMLTSIASRLGCAFQFLDDILDGEGLLPMDVTVVFVQNLMEDIDKEFHAYQEKFIDPKNKKEMDSLKNLIDFCSEIFDDPKPHDKKSKK